MNKNKTDNVPAPAEKRAAYSNFEIVRSDTFGSDDSQPVETTYQLLNLDDWDQPMNREKLEELHRFLGDFLSAH